MTKLKVVSVALALLAIMALQVVISGAASAAVSWCDTDLGPMSTTAEQRNAAQASHAEGLVVSAPAQAISVDKGGTNTHK